MNIQQIFELLSLGDEYFESGEPSVIKEDDDTTALRPNSENFLEEQAFF